MQALNQKVLKINLSRKGKNMFGIGIWELIFILIIALIIFGPGKLPEVGKAIGRGLSEFKKASKEIESDITGNVSSQSKKEIEEQEKKV